MPDDGKAGKGANTTISLLWNGIQRFNKGEMHLRLVCDNCSGQNKNNTMIQFATWLVLTGRFSTIDIQFPIPGHTKFLPDAFFGLIKLLYRKSRVMCMADLVHVVESSTASGQNKAALYLNGQEFVYYDFKEYFERFFKKLPILKKYHHFYFTSSSPGNVYCKEKVSSAQVQYKILRKTYTKRLDHSWKGMRIRMKCVRKLFWEWIR